MCVPQDDGAGSGNISHVVCRQLGYANGHSADKFQQKTTIEAPVWLDNVRCTGNETKLEDCKSNPWGVARDNCNDLHVICTHTGKLHVQSKWTRI